MDRHQKRTLSIARPPIDSPRSTKKRKIGVTIESLSREELDIVAKAAAILKVSVSNVPEALSRLQSTSQSPPTPPRKARSNLNRKAKRKVAVQNTRTMTRESSSPSRGEPEKLHPDSRPTESISSHGVACSSNYFGFDLMPQRWSDCFASLIPSTTQMIEQDFGGPSNLPMSNPAASIRSGHDTAYLNPTQTFQSHLDANESMRGMIQRPEGSLDFELFACDDQYDFAQLLQSYPPIQPTAGTTDQPQLGEPMKYSSVIDNYSSFHWNGNSHHSLENEHTSQSPLINIEPLESTSSETENNENMPASACNKGSRRGAFQSPHDREQTAQTRKLTACMRCRMQRIRCEPDPNDLHGVCLTCKNVTTLKLSKLPCLRYKITDVKMFHLKPAPGRKLTDRWSYKNLEDVSTWDLDSRVDTIQITQDYVSKPLSLRVRKFVPLEGDVLYRSWFDNNTKMRKSVMIPPYALVDLDAAEKEYINYVNQGGAEFFKGILDNEDKFVWSTYSMAIATANNPGTSEEERKLLKMVLRLWISVRLMNRAERIVGMNTLGMPTDLIDASSPLHGKVPIPPVMSVQIDSIITQKLQVPLRKKVLEALQNLIRANKPGAWFSIYLCIFVLLHNCSMLTKFEEFVAKKHGMKTRFSRMDMVAEYHLGASILLAYFHYSCKGYRPFALDWDVNGTKSMAELSLEQIQFIKQTAAHVSSNELRYNTLRKSESYDDHHFFVAQLYEESWVPRPTKI